MEIGKVIFQKLFDRYEITQIVGDKIYPLTAGEERTAPYIVYSTQGDKVTSKDVLKVARAQVQVDIYGTSYDQSRTLAGLCLEELEKYGYAQHGMTVKYAEIENDADTYEDERKLFHVQQDYKIIYQW